MNFLEELKTRKQDSAQRVLRSHHGHEPAGGENFAGSIETNRQRETLLALAFESRHSHDRKRSRSQTGVASSVVQQGEAQNFARKSSHRSIGQREIGGED